MSRIFILPLIAAIFLFSIPLQARDFTVDDFDPRDASMVEVYRMAIDDLMDELTVHATDADGNELFTVVPFPMELVALMAQMEIHSLESDDPAEIDAVIERANNNKPGPNSFAFLLDGDPEWVSENVRMVYDPSDGSEPVEIQTVSIGEGEQDNGSMVAEWMVVVEDFDVLIGFLESPHVILRIEKTGEGAETMELDCGFWRQWGLFDLRAEEEQGESQSSPTSP